MHAKYLSILALSSVALASDANLPRDYDDVPTLDEYMSEHDTGDIPTTTFGSGSYSTSGSSSGSSYDDEDESSGSGNAFGGYDIPSSIVSEIQNLPPSVLSEITDPTSLSSAYSDALDGKPPSWATDLPQDVKDYIESAYGVELPASSTDSPSSGGDGDSSSSSSSSSGSNQSGGGDGDAAGMLSPSILASVVGAVGVLAVAVAL